MAHLKRYHVMKPAANLINALLLGTLEVNLLESCL